MLRARLHPQPAPRRRLPLAPTAAFSALLGVLVLAGFFPTRIAGTATQPVFAAQRLVLPGLPAASGAGAGSELATRAIPLTILTAPSGVDAAGAAQGSTDAVRQTLQQSGGGDAPQQQTDRTPIFFEYKVQNGDTVSGIAARFGIATKYISWNNVDILSDEDALTPGMTLQIPSVEGVIHSVRYGETVTEIAARYDAKTRDIVEFSANGLAGDPNRLREGVLILVPGGRNVPLAPAARPSAVVARPPDVVTSSALRPAPAPPPAPAPAAVAAVPASAPAAAPRAATTSSSGWVWPGGGPLTSAYGPSHPLGIDIGTGYGAPIGAARDGTVTFAGGNPCCSYGYHVIVAHDGGYETLYAHLSTISVQLGQKVTAGAILGHSGTSGRVTGPHLHFEIHRNGTTMNPSAFLP